MRNYGKFLKEARKEQNKTQMEVSKATKIPQSNISAWEKGINIPAINFCEILADFYGISLDELIGREYHENHETIRNTYNNNGIHNGNVEFK